MERFLKIVIAIALVSMLVPTQYVRAAQYDQVEQEFSYLAPNDSDEIQNRLDETTETNRDTWDPVPTGVYMGPWSKESSFQLSLVPDDDCSIIVAQVVKFESDTIMNGASYFIVRLPLSTTYEFAYLDIYEIERDTTWTFEENITHMPTGHSRNNLRINFTGGNQSLVAWTYTMEPSDESPTDGDFYYSRNNRTYCMVRAPIRTDTYYLFVTTAKYESDAYVEIYWSPESLTGDWNYSALATYNKVAPDTFYLEIDTFNISAGYSFDFQEGFGASMCGYDKYNPSGSQYKFYKKIQEVDLDHYLTFMFPFYQTTTNVSIRTVVQAWDFAGNNEYLIDDIREWNDFILISSDDTIDNLIAGAWKNHWEGWLRIKIQVLNNTRLRVYTRDLEFAPSGFNATWDGDDGSLFQDTNLVHAPGWNWQPEHYFLWNDTAGPPVNYEYVYWQIQSYVQLNDYKWLPSNPPGDNKQESPSTWESILFASKHFFASNKLFIKYDEDEPTYELTPLGGFMFGSQPMDFISNALIQSVYAINDYAGRAWDGLNWAWEKLKDLGLWLWKVGQSIVGVVTWFIETITYYASIILGLIVLVIALIILFLPMWFSAKFGQIIVNALRGRHDLAIKDLGDISGKAMSAAPGRGRVS